MKKPLSLVIIGVILGSTVALAGSKVFSDIPTDAWYASAVSSLSEKGIIEGYPDGTFGGGNTLNRAEIAVMLDRTIQYIETGEVKKEIPATQPTTTAPNNTLTSSCSAPKSALLADLYNKIQDVIYEANDNIINAVAKTAPTYPAYEDDEFFIKGVVGKISDKIYSTAIEIKPITFIPEYLFANVVEDSPSISRTGSVSKYNDNTRMVSYETQDCTGIINGSCYDHLAFPFQYQLKIDDNNNSAELETIYATNDPQFPNVTITVEDFTEANALYNCIKTDLKALSDKHGKTPSQW